MEFLWLLAQVVDSILFEGDLALVLVTDPFVCCYFHLVMVVAVAPALLVAPAVHFAIARL